MTCKRRCNKNSSAQPEYLEGSKYCSICKKFILTEETYCFCCEYMLGDYTVEENPSKVSYFNGRLKNIARS